MSTNDGKLYISAIFDCYDLAVLGLAMDTNMKAGLCEQTLDNAVKAYPMLCGAILHSDRGTQYTSELYRKAINKYGIRQSMNSAGGSIDRTSLRKKCKVILTISIALANLYIYELILLLSWDIQNSFNSVLKVDHPITAATVEYINNNIEAKISLSDVAKNCNVSKRYLTEIFKKHINVTVNVYINITKIKKTIEYIYDSDESLTDIAYRLNFGSVQYFSAVFKKYAGVAPREFKNLNSRQV